MATKMITFVIGAVILLGPALLRCECAAAETRAQELLRQGNEALDRDDFNLAIRRYTEALRLNPKLEIGRAHV